MFVDVRLAIEQARVWHALLHQIKDEYSMNSEGNEQADEVSHDSPKMSSHRL